uniref:Uncharacterized protein n=1 Tax=Oryza barthii TaxID=65489 RepID=A0A0D3GZJ0_9ORYZ
MAAGCPPSGGNGGNNLSSRKLIIALGLGCNGKDRLCDSLCDCEDAWRSDSSMRGAGFATAAREMGDGLSAMLYSRDEMYCNKYELAT